MRDVFRVEAGWLTAVLLAGMATVAAWGIAAAGWDPGLWSLWVIGVLGVGAGCALARSRFPGWLALVCTAAYGLFVVGLFAVLALPPASLHARAVEIAGRLNLFLYKALFGGTSRDTLPFTFSVGLILWFIGAGMSWAVFRRSAAWTAILPAGLALLVNAYYYYGPRSLDEYLATYVVLALLLLTRMSLLAREREWRLARVQYNPDMRFDFLRAGLVVAVAAALVAWAGPTLAASPAAEAAWEDLTGPWKVVRESWSRLFASVRSYGRSVDDFYGDSLTLTGAARLSNARVLDVRVGFPADRTEPEEGLPPPPEERYYWRALSYEIYQDGQWLPGQLEPVEALPDRLGFHLPPYELRRDVTLTITPYKPLSRLYDVAQTLWVDRRATFDLVPLGEHLVDVASVRADKVVRGGESYQVFGSVSTADADSLRGAGTDYPDWVAERYLQLPATVSARTQLLAQTIVADAQARNPYDQAQAVTDWLRSNITYDDTIGPPPAGLEPVEYVLFYSRRGFCNYYASAMVMLLRELGIPARLAVGFAQGAYTTAGYYQVLEKNAHAWPEVYFPHYGWVEFEPTASEAPIVRPQRPTAASGPVVNLTPPVETTPNAEPTPTPDRPNPNQADAPPVAPPAWLSADALTWAVTLAAALILVLAGAGAVYLVRSEIVGLDNLGGPGRMLMRLRGLALPSAAALAYLNLERAARWLGLPVSAAHTPYERAASVGGELPAAGGAAYRIAAEYTVERYGTQAADAAAAQSAWQTVRGAAWRKGAGNLAGRWRARLVRRLTELRQSRRRPERPV